jgi:hypothetical protein
MGAWCRPRRDAPWEFHGVFGMGDRMKPVSLILKRNAFRTRDPVIALAFESV